MTLKKRNTGKNMKNFGFIWKDNHLEIGKGETIREALTNKGYGQGVLQVLDYYVTLPDEIDTREKLRKWLKEEKIKEEKKYEKYLKNYKKPQGVLK